MIAVALQLLSQRKSWMSYARPKLDIFFSWKSLSVKKHIWYKTPGMQNTETKTFHLNVIFSFMLSFINRDKAVKHVICLPYLLPFSPIKEGNKCHSKMCKTKLSKYQNRITLLSLIMKLFQEL